jgi:hypothetical protein
MDRQKQFITFAVVAAVVIAAVFIFIRKPIPPPAPGAPLPTEGATSRPAPTGPRLETIVPKGGGEPMRVVRARGTDVLATVNGVAITLKDLIPLAPADLSTEQTLSPEVYDAFLKRAIERELTDQAARAQGIQLTDGQQQQLERFRAMSQHHDPDVLQEMNKTPALVEFDVRDDASLLLQGNLAAQAGLPSPFVTPGQVEEYYAAHKADYGELPAEPEAHDAAWRQIDFAVRQKLTPEVQARYQEALRGFLDSLKAKANIKVVGPVESPAAAPPAKPAIPAPTP